MNAPSPVIHIVMFGWLPVLFAIFAIVRGHRAVAAAFLIAWLFLPMWGYPLKGFPDYTKVSATTVGVFIAAILFDSGRLTRFRPRWFDLPMVAWCLVPIPTSLTNGLGPYDAVSDTVNQIVTWGLPYFLGRLYFSSLVSLRDLAIGIALGGLLYLPLCLLEIKMSPQLHSWVYGYHQHDFAQTLRFGGWRPTVFMQHGLAVSTFMATACLATFWLWMSRSVKAIWGVPIFWLMCGLLITTILTKSALSIFLLAAAMGALTLLKYGRTRLAIAPLVVVPVVYVALRTTGWSGQELVQFASLAGPDRVGSLQTRLDSENILWAHASAKPIFGWGGFGRNMPVDEFGRTMAIPDGLWIILVGKYGLIGLMSFAAAMLIGPARLYLRSKSRHWNHPAMAGAVAIAMMLVVHMCDNLLNAMINPIFVLGAGGLAGVVMGGIRRPVLAPTAEPSEESESDAAVYPENAPRPVVT
jgi:hypothetical protein